MSVVEAKPVVIRKPRSDKGATRNPYNTERKPRTDIGVKRGAQSTENRKKRAIECKPRVLTKIRADKGCSHNITKSRSDKGETRQPYKYNHVVMLDKIKKILYTQGLDDNKIQDMTVDEVRQMLIC